MTDDLITFEVGDVVRVEAPDMRDLETDQPVGFSGRGTVVKAWPHAVMVRPDGAAEDDLLYIPRSHSGWSELTKEEAS